MCRYIYLRNCYRFKSAMDKRKRLSKLAIKILSFNVYANIMKTSLDEKYPFTLTKSKPKCIPLNVMSFSRFLSKPQRPGFKNHMRILTPNLMVNIKVDDALKSLLPVKKMARRQKPPHSKFFVFHFLKFFMVSEVHNLLIVQWLPV